MRKPVVFVAFLTFLFCSRSFGNVVITLEPKDVAGNAISGLVTAGAQVFVDILLSADDVDNPLADVRGIQLDFAATSGTIDLVEFTWLVSTSAYSVQISSFPAPGAATTRFSSSPDLIILDETPLLVATLVATVNGDGTLDLGFSPDPGQNSAAGINAGFDPIFEFRPEDGNVTGGSLMFVVEGTSGGGDSDGDGVPDDMDAFPLDPAETTDSDGDGTGDNADAFPLDPAEQLDTDSDNIGNNADLDDDGDGVNDTDDAFPLDPTETADSDGDGIGDNAEQNQNSGPRVGGGFCGIGMLGTSFGIFLGMCGLRLLGMSFIGIGRRRNCC